MAQPRFYYDLASPDAYLAAERVMHVLPEIPEWIPVRLGGLAPFFGASLLRRRPAS